MVSFGWSVIGASLVVCMVVAPCSATFYSVGDGVGWTAGADYSSWASGKTFYVGDTLVFNYEGGNTVDEVSGSDYNTCTVGNPITRDDSGSTRIRLETKGYHYFISAASGSCPNGMRLAIYAHPPPTSSTTGSGTFSEI